MSEHTGQPTPPEHTDESVVRAALEARAATAVVEPGAWERLEEARGKAPRLRVLRPQWHGRGPLLALAAAAAALLAIAVLTLGGGEVADRLGTDPGERRSTVTEEIVTGPVDDAPGTTVVAAGTTVPEATAPAAGGFADLRNAVYPSTLCPDKDMRMPGDTFRLVNGEAPGANGAPGSTVVSLGDAVVGDFDGDGRREAVAAFMCGGMNSDWLVRFVAVLGERPEGLEVLATRTSSGARPTAVRPTVADDRTENVVSETVNLIDSAAAVAVVDGRLVAVTWDQNEGVGSEVAAFEQQVTYRWTGQELAVERMGERRQVQPATGYADEARYAIRRAGVRSMTVPLAAAGRDDRTRLCADVFSPAGPLPAVTFVDGVAAVPGAAGPGQDGTIRLEAIYYRTIAFPLPEDALVVVSCQVPQGSMRRVAVVRLVDGRPTVIDVVHPRVFELSAAMEIAPLVGDRMTLLWWTGRPQDGPETAMYRWDGSHFVLV